MLSKQNMNKFYPLSLCIIPPPTRTLLRLQSFHSPSLHPPIYPPCFPFSDFVVCWYADDSRSESASFGRLRGRKWLSQVWDVVRILAELNHGPRPAQPRFRLTQRFAKWVWMHSGLGPRITGPRRRASGWSQDRMQVHACLCIYTLVYIRDRVLCVCARSCQEQNKLSALTSSILYDQ